MVEFDSSNRAEEVARILRLVLVVHKQALQCKRVSVKRERNAYSFASWSFSSRFAASTSSYRTLGLSGKVVLGTPFAAPQLEEAT